MFETDPYPIDADCPYFYGEKFPDLDCPHWLPYMAGDEIGQPNKLTIPFLSDSEGNDVAKTGNQYEVA